MVIVWNGGRRVLGERGLSSGRRREGSAATRDEQKAPREVYCRRRCLSTACVFSGRRATEQLHLLAAKGKGENDEREGLYASRVTEEGEEKEPSVTRQLTERRKPDGRRKRRGGGAIEGERRAACRSRRCVCVCVCVPLELKNSETSMDQRWWLCSRRGKKGGSSLPVYGCLRRWLRRPWKEGWGGGMRFDNQSRGRGSATLYSNRTNESRSAAGPDRRWKRRGLSRDEERGAE